MRKAFIMFAVLVAVSCSGGIRKQVRGINYTMAVTVVSTDHQVTKFVESADGTHQLCLKIEEEYGKKIEECGGVEACEDEMEAKAVETCKAHVADFESKFDNVLSRCADSLELLESVLDTWKDISDKKKLDALLDAFTSVTELVDLLKGYGVEVPGDLLDLLENIDDARDALKGGA